MRHMRGAEQKVAGADLGDSVFHPVAARSSGDDIEFIALMRNLRPVRGSCGEPDFKISINEHLGGSPRCPRQRKCRSKRRRRWRAIHGWFLLAAASFLYPESSDGMHPPHRWLCPHNGRRRPAGERSACRRSALTLARAARCVELAQPHQPACRPVARATAWRAVVHAARPLCQQIEHRLDILLRPHESGGERHHRQRTSFGQHGGVGPRCQASQWSLRRPAGGPFP
jgi:hypothetical protein